MLFFFLHVLFLYIRQSRKQFFNYWGSCLVKLFQSHAKCGLHGISKYTYTKTRHCPFNRTITPALAKLKCKQPVCRQYMCGGTRNGIASNAFVYHNAKVSLWGVPLKPSASTYDCGLCPHISAHFYKVRGQNIAEKRTKNRWLFASDILSHGSALPSVFRSVIIILRIICKLYSITALAIPVLKAHKFNVSGYALFCLCHSLSFFCKFAVFAENIIM